MLQRHTFHNGVRVIAEKIPHVRSVSMGIWVGVGSDRETGADNGITHLIEHMFFKGTKKRTARELAVDFDEIAGDVNAFTSKELTCFYVKVLDQYFSVSLELLSDMFFNSVFHEEELEKEKKVIIEEIRMVEDMPDDLVHDLLFSASLGKHPLSLPILGTEENVTRFTREDLLHYKHRFYQPDNVVIALAGNLPDDYLEQIGSWFSAFQGNMDTVVEVKPIFTPNQVVRRKPTEQSHLCLGLPGIPLSDERMYMMVLLNNIIGGNMSSRLFQEIREERGLAYSVFSYHSSHPQTGLWAVYVGTRQGQEGEVAKRIREILFQVKQHGVTNVEFEKSRQQLKGSIMLGLESTSNRMNRLGRNELLLNRHLELHEIIAQIDQIDCDKVNQLAAEIFTPSMSMAAITPLEDIDIEI